MKGKPLWKRVWFWAFVVCSVGVAVVLWPSNSPIVGRWVLQTGAVDGSSEETTGYEFSKFGKFEGFGASPNLVGNYRLEGSNLVVLEVKGIVAVVDGRRQEVSIGDKYPKEMFPPIKLWMNAAADGLNTEANPWTGSRSQYTKDHRSSL